MPSRASRRNEDPMSKAPSKTTLALTEDVYRLIARSRRLLLATAGRALAARDRSVLMWQVLAWLEREGAQTQRQLATSVAQDPAGLSRLLEEMEAQKLLARTPDPTDGRKLLVRVTRKGKAQLAADMPSAMTAVDEVMSGLGTDERLALKTLLERLLETHEARLKDDDRGREVKPKRARMAKKAG